MNRRLAVSAIVAAVLVLFGRSAAAEVLVDDYEDVSDWTGLEAERTTRHAGAGAGRWDAHERVPTIKKVFTPALDLSRERQLLVWVWSAKANGAAITVVLDSENVADAAGRDYFQTEFVVDWRGWKLLALPLADFKRARQPIGWQRINYISLNASGWGNTPRRDTALVLDDLTFGAGAIAELQVDQAWQGADFVYTYSVTLEERLGRPRQLTLALELAPGFPFVPAVPTAAVSLPARGRRDAFATLTVPAAQITDARRLALHGATLVVSEQGVARDGRAIAAAVPLPRREHPRTLLTRADFERIAAWSQAHAWAREARDSLVDAARRWPAPFLTKYGVSQWALPPEGGQWSQWYVCPRHHVNLEYAPPMTHRCPVDGATYSGWPYEQVIYARMHADLIAAARDQGLTWQLVGDRPAAERAAQILLAYADAYATLPLHDKNGGSASSRARVTAQTLNEAIWLIDAAWAYDLIADVGVLTAPQRRHIEQHLLRAAVAVIERNPRGSSNWQSWHNAGIGSAAFAIDDPVAIAHAFRSGSDGFDFQLQHSITADGVWHEGAWGYHFYALDGLINLAEMGARAGLDPYGGALGAPLRAMFAVPLKFALPDGTLPAFNDSRGVSLWDKADYFAEVGYQRYRDPTLAAFLRQAPRGRDALLWGAESVPATRPPTTPSIVLPDAGYAILRAGTGAQTSYLALDFGPHGGWHGHFDKLGYVLYARGGLLGVDPGTQPYAVPSHNTWDKVTLAHNTVVVDEESQAEAQGALHRFVAVPALSMATADAGPAYAKASLLRTLVLTPEYVLDRFRVAARDGQAHQLDWIHHAPGQLSTPTTLAAYSGLPTSAGYQHLEQPRGAAVAGDWRVSFDQASAGVPFGSVWSNKEGIQASFSAARQPAAEGYASGRLSYDFTRASGYVLYSAPKLVPLEEQPATLHLQVFGDGSKNALALRLNDAKDERFVRDVGVIDWTGWKTFDLADLASWRHSGGDGDGVFDVPALRVAIELRSTADGSPRGTLYVDELRLTYRAAGDRLVADFEGASRGLRLRMAGQQGTSLVVGEALGPDPLLRLPFAMARRRTRETTFLSLLEPYGEAPTLTEFLALRTSATPADEALAVTVRGPAFDDRLLALGDGRGGTERSFGDATCDGVLCQVRRSADSLQRVVLAEGAFVRDAARVLVQATTALRTLQLDWQADGARLGLVAEGPTGTELRIWGPRIEQVVVGNVAVPFGRDGEYVRLRLAPRPDAGVHDADRGHRDASAAGPRDGGAARQGEATIESPLDAGLGQGGCGCSQTHGSGRRDRHWAGMILLVAALIRWHRRRRRSSCAFGASSGRFRKAPLVAGVNPRDFTL